MAKINIQENKRILFSSIQPGCIFLYYKVAYIKIVEVYSKNCVDLNTGFGYKLDPKCPILLPQEATIEIKIT